MIKVWDGETCVWRQDYDRQAAYAGSANISGAVKDDGVTPLTVKFAEPKGLATHKGNNLTVTSEWATTMAGADAASANLSIVVGEWTE